MLTYSLQAYGRTAMRRLRNYGIKYISKVTILNNIFDLNQYIQNILLLSSSFIENFLAKFYTYQKFNKYLLQI